MANTIKPRPLRPDPDDETDATTDAGRVEAETRAENDNVIVQLVTDRGKADIEVPPSGRWRSSARAALFSRGDDLTWATTTLSPEDADTWLWLDPTSDDSNEFFTRWRLATGQDLGESRASRRASGASRGR